jgi:CheY-like chemotaxis protein
MNAFRILVVDDEPNIRALFQDALQRSGYQVTTAASGPEALSLAGNQRFDLAFLDIKMPGLNGVDTLKALKQLNPEVNVVMITGYAAEDLVAASLNSGAFVCLTKPFGIAQILEVVRTITDEAEEAEEEPVETAAG